MGISPRDLRVLVAIWLVAVVVASSDAAEETEPPRLEVGGTVTGTLSEDEPEVRTPGLAHYALGAVQGRAHSLILEEPGTYTIDLNSAYVTTYLVVRDEAGSVVAEGKDGLIPPDSRVVLQGVAAGTYEVIACRVSETAGPFRLSVARGAPAPMHPVTRASRSIEEVRARVRIIEEAEGESSPALVLALQWESSVFQGMGRFAEAAVPTRRALAIAEATEGPESAAAASCMTTLGTLLFRLQSLDEAQAMLERALGITETVHGPESGEAALPLTNLSRILTEKNELDRAREYSERALRIQEAVYGPDHGIVAFGLSSLAKILQKQGDYASARPLQERVIQIWTATLGPGHPQTLTGRRELAAIWSYEGRLEEAGRLLEENMAVLEVAYARGHESAVRTLQQLAVVRQRQGRLREARALCERAMAFHDRYQASDSGLLADTLSTLGNVLHGLGNATDAKPLLERSVEINRSIRGERARATLVSLNNLALVEKSLGKSDVALQHFETALAVYEETGQLRDARSVLSNLAFLYVDLRDLAKAAELCKRAIAIDEKTLPSDHPDRALAWHNLGSSLQSLGKLTEAREAMEQAVAIREASLDADHPLLALSLNNLAQVLHQSGRTAEAWTLVRRAAAASESHVCRVAWSLTESERMSFAKQHWNTLVTLLSIARTVGTPDAQREAYEVLLRWKGRVSRSLVHTREAILADLSGERGKLVDELRDLQAELSTGVFQKDVDDQDAHERRLSDLRQRREQLERELLSDLQGVGRERPVSVGELAAALPEDAVLIDFFVHPVYLPGSLSLGEASGIHYNAMPPMLTAWIVRPGKNEVERLEVGLASMLEETTRSFLAELVRSRGVASSEEETEGPDVAQKTRSMLWSRLESRVGDARKIFVSPDGFLGTLPFEVLQREDETYLIEHYAFVYLQEAGSLLDLVSAASREREDESRGGLLAVGAVDYRKGGDLAWREAAEGTDSEPSMPEITGEASEQMVAIRGSFADYWGRLPATDLESSVVMDLHEETFEEDEGRLLLRGSEANEERIKYELSRHRVVHLATHGFFQPEGLPSMWEQVKGQRGVEMRMREEQERLTGMLPGLLSGLVFAGANKAPKAGRDDGLLTAEEISFLDLSGVDLIVLSACETGLGRPEAGEGLLGLRRTFQLAGARTVISSLWSVRDDSTSELMRNFYARLWLRDQSRLEALRGAQLDLLKKNRIENEGRGLPSTWGAFVLSGAWD